MKRNFKGLVFAAMTVSAAGYSHAQTSTDVEQSIEEVKVIGTLSEYSATKTDTPILETARSISIETAEDLINIGAIELADAYTYSSGVTGEAYGFSTRGDWLFVRGLSAPQYRDSLQSLFGNYNNTRPEVYTLEQVEVLKGPVSVLYGQGSPGGIVNVVSKRARVDSPKEINLSLGNFDYQQVSLDFGGEFDQQGHWLYRLVGLKRDTDTQVDFVSDEATVFAPSITYRPSDDTEVSLIGLYQDSDSVAGAQFLPISGTLTPAPNGQFFDPSLYTGEPGFSDYDGETKSLTLLANHRFNDTWSMQATARKSQGERFYEQAWISFSFSPDRYLRNPDGSLFGNGRVPRTFYQADSDSDQQAIDLRFRADFTLGSVENELMIGTQLQDVKTTNNTNFLYGLGLPGTAGESFGDTYWFNPFAPSYGNVPPQAVLDLARAPEVRSDVKDRGFYINDQLTIGNLHWNFGLRYDDVENSNGVSVQKDDATSFATGALYAFDNGLSPYLSYAESFEPAIGVDAITGAPFKPQEGEQVEVGVKYLLPSDTGYLTLAYFDIERSNILESTPIGSIQADGVDKVDGVEFEAKINLGHFNVELNATDLNTKKNNGFRIASIPEKSASMWLGYEQSETQGFVAGLGVRYSGPSFDGVDALETPSFTLLDAMLGYHFNENWSVRINSRNLTDKYYQSTCLSRGDCFPGERRRVIGTITFNY